MAAITRGVVMASVVLAVATGVWALADSPAIAGVLFGAFVGGAAAGRWALSSSARVVLTLVFVAPGLIHLAGGPAGGPYPYAVLAAFAGLLVGGTPWTQWMAASPWRIAVAWWAIGVAVTWPVFAWRDLEGAPARAFLVLPIVTAALVQMAAALWLDFLLSDRPPLDVRDGRPLAARFFPAFVASAVMTAAAAIYQGTVDLTWLNSEPWISLGRATGLTGDANPMGVATALWAPIAAAFAPATAAGRVAGLCLGLVLVGGAWMSGARTAVLMLAVSAIGLGLYEARRRRFSTRRLAVAAIATAVTAVLVIAAIPSRRGSPTDRLRQNLPASRSLGDYAYETLWVRDGYGLAAVEAVKEHPWFGVGVGRFEGQSVGYYRRLKGWPIAPDNAQNLWRQMLAEQGLVGFAPVLWLTVLTAIALARPLRAAEDLTVRAAVIGLGGALVVGYPVQDTGVALTLATLVGAVASSASPR